MERNKNTKIRQVHVFSGDRDGIFAAVMKIAFFLLIAILFFTACLEDADCLRQSSTRLRIAFKKKSDGTNLQVDIKQILALGSDSIFYAPDDVTMRNAVELLINPYDTQTSFVFQLPDEPDTELMVGYSSQTRFISPDCGREEIFTGLHVVNSGFDSLRVINNVLSEANTVNIEIFR